MRLPTPTSRVRLGFRALFFFTLASFLPWTARAHVGSPDVFYDGSIGPYQARIVIRMPPVVPGRARIEVRPQTGQPLTVSVRPLYSKSAVKNAPPPEPASPVAGEPGLYGGDLWLMSTGAYSIEVRLQGATGEGAAEIPVNSVATHQLPLPPALEGILIGLGSLLAVGGLAIVYAAAGESVLEPGAPMQRADRRRGLIASVIAAVIVTLLLAGGWQWWKVEEGEFRRNLREGAWPDLSVTASTEGSRRLLHLTLGDKAFKPDYAIPLLHDHGKLLHLFLIREPDHDAFAHLHPIRQGGKSFDLALPALPEGNYKVLCDFTLSDSGLSSTAAGSVHIPAIPPIAEPGAGPASILPDPDDSWAVASPAATPASPGDDTSFTLPNGGQMLWKTHPPLRVKHDAQLEFVCRDDAGQPLPLEPYMGMMSHAAILRSDGAIFAHLHPTGNYSMAAESFFAAKIAREAAKDAGLAAPAEMDHSKMDHSKMGHGSSAGASSSTIVIPYEFPTSGAYRIWVQIKTGGRVLTGVFDTTVEP